jgi:hypothetical protein
MGGSKSMKKILIIAFFLFFVSSSSYAVDLTGRWEGSLSISSSFSGIVIMDLEQDGKRVNGTLFFSIDGEDDRSGRIRGTIRKNTLRFSIMITSPECPASYRGTARIATSGDLMDFTFRGNDCDGKQRGEGSVELLD